MPISNSENLKVIGNIQHVTLTIKFKNILYVPDLRTNLVLVAKITTRKHKLSTFVIDLQTSSSSQITKVIFILFAKIVSVQKKMPRLNQHLLKNCSLKRSITYENLCFFLMCFGIEEAMLGQVNKLSSVQTTLLNLPTTNKHSVYANTNKTKK